MASRDASSGTGSEGHRRVGDHTGQESQLLHLIDELQGPHWHLALAERPDHRTVGDQRSDGHAAAPIPMQKLPQLPPHT